MEEILKKFDELATKVDSISKRPEAFMNPYESKELDKLYMALSKAQMEMEVAKTDASNPFFKSKYADLASIVKASRRSLSANGLSVVQRILPNGGGALYLYTRLCHASGQWLESKMPLNPPKSDIQSIGSYITYLKRYNYAMVCGVVTSDEDDDGEVAMQVERRQDPKLNVNPEKISKAQLQLLSTELEGYEEVLESLLKGYKIAKLSDLMSKNYTACMNQIRNIKRAKES